MADRNKNGKSALRNFLRYHSDRMKNEERNAFERELQKDPFAREASEGFASLEPNEAVKDAADLQKRLKKRASKHQRLTYYRIAASIAVLMVISSVFIIIDRNRSPVEIASSTDQSGTLDIKESRPVIVPADNGQAREKPVRSTEKKRAQRKEKRIEHESDKQIMPVENERIAAVEHFDSVKEPEIKQPEKYFRSEESAAAPMALAIGKRASLNQVQGRVVSSEDNAPVAGVSIVIKGSDSGVMTDAEGKFSIALPDSENHTLVASFIGMESKEVEATPDTPALIRMDPSLASLSEVIVTAYGVKKSKSDNDNLQSGYIPPRPANGKSGFDKYIRENLQRPDTNYSGQKAVVMNFIVHTDGTVDSIKIIRSPGKPFSDEAIRLIRSGPDWKPAEEDGKLIEDQVRVRIVFK